jgi:phospholipid/cholesterol/gamma-HCH transport system substrate-binding protein
MTPRHRNIFVGATVLGALVALGWMVLKFGAGPVRMFSKPTMPVRFVSASAEGVGEGSPVQYRGVAVGRVVSVDRSENLLEVVIQAEVDRDPPLPANIRGRIRSQSVLGSGSAINLVLTSAEPTGVLSAGTTLQAEYVGLDVLPAEYTALATELQAAARQFRESNIVTHLDEQVAKLGTSLDQVNKVIGDEQSQANVRASLENFRAATESANRVAQNLEKTSLRLQELSEQASDTMGAAQTAITNTDKHIQDLAEQTRGRIEQMGRLLETVQQITAKVNDGKGTAGMLVNDARLYESLVDVSHELSATVADLRRLTEQWEQEGVSLKLGK